MTVQFAHKVLIDGGEVQRITLAGATINYGTRSAGESMVPANAYMTLISYDAAAGVIADFPEFSFGAGVTSGMVREYRPKYEGGETKLVVGAPVEIRTTTPSGMVRSYSATYDGGFESTRFTGVITAIEYTPSSISITAVSMAESLTRVFLTPASWPVESETDRVTRISQAADIPIDIEGTTTATVTATSDKPTRVSAYAMLIDLAKDCDALLFARRDGEIVYRTRNAVTGHTTVDLDPGATLLDNLTMTSELGDVINKVTATYGPPDAQGVRPTFTIVDDRSFTDFGERALTVDLQLEQETDARTYVNRVLDRSADPYWHMPTATVNMNLARLKGFPGGVQDILDLDLDDDVRLPRLLAGSPVPSYLSRVLGYQEYLDPRDWSITFSLNPAGWTKP
jgi:hypothetical protein